MIKPIADIRARRIPKRVLGRLITQAKLKNTTVEDHIIEILKTWIDEDLDTVVRAGAQLRKTFEKVNDSEVDTESKNCGYSYWPQV
jgi:hypothetical protein